MTIDCERIHRLYEIAALGTTQQLEAMSNANKSS